MTWAIIFAGACSGPPDPFVYYPGLSYPRLAQLDMDSAKAMRDQWVDTFTVYQADLDELRVVEPAKGKLVLRAENIVIHSFNDLFQSGTANVYPSDALDRKGWNATLRGLFESLASSGWVCEGLAVTAAALADGTLIASSEAAMRKDPKNDAPRVGLFRCTSPPETSRATIRFKAYPFVEEGPTWTLNIDAPWGQRCKAFPPNIYQAYRDLCEGDP